jgi:hypothetical protein
MFIFYLRVRGARQIVWKDVIGDEVSRQSRSAAEIGEFSSLWAPFYTFSFTEGVYKEGYHDCFRHTLYLYRFRARREGSVAVWPCKGKQSTYRATDEDKSGKRRCNALIASDRLS